MSTSFLKIEQQLTLVELADARTTIEIQKQAAVAMDTEIGRLAGEVERAQRIACEAMANARILASSYEKDCRPPGKVVNDSLAYPVYPIDVFKGESS